MDTTTLTASVFVSIHALKEVRPENMSNPQLLMQFQSTHPKGGATILHGARYLTNEVSIHASLRVRLTIAPVTEPLPRFKSTHPKGCDMQRGAKKYPWRSFNPRTYGWCDTCKLTFSSILLSFNPRSPKGCDIIFI